MILLIDAYNLLKQLQPGNTTDAQKNAYINRLQRYYKKKMHTITMVFDGGQSHYPYKQSDNGITVVYAGFLYSADDVIKQYIDRYAGRQVLLVSSDRQLIDYARRYSVASIDPLQFDRFVQQALQGQTTIKHIQASTVVRKLHEQEMNPDIDTLMLQASETIMQKNEPEDVNLVHHGQKKLTKKERIYYNIIKKL